MSIKSKLAARDELARDDVPQGVAEASPPKPLRRLVTRCVADVEPEALEWLWPGLIPLGKLCLFSGDPGLGKSFVTVDLASRVSRGKAWPVSVDGSSVEQPSGSVVFLACEDDVADTVRPRLDRANADVRRIHVVDGVRSADRDRGFGLDSDLDLLADHIRGIGDVRLLVIDPISAYFGQTDSHKNSDIRAVLSPLTSLAAEMRFAVIAINHLTKGGGKAIYRSLGSVAIAAAARVALNFYRDPDDGNRRLILPTKMNLAPESAGLAYQIEDGSVWWSVDPVSMTADEIQCREIEAQTKPSDRQSLSARDEAIEFLRERLAAGPVESKTTVRDAKEHGIAESTLRRAYKSIGGKPQKSSGDGPWHWSWPSDTCDEPDLSALISDSNSGREMI